MRHCAQFVMVLVAVYLACACTKAVDPGRFQASDTSLKQPACEGQSRFLQGLPSGFLVPHASNDLEVRLLATYGAVLLARGGTTPPPLLVFPDEASVARWQSSLRTDRVRIGEVVVELQPPALKALQEARAEAQRKGLEVTARGPDSSRRTYANTVRLWKSQVEPGLNHWVKKGRLTAQQAATIGGLPPRDQVAEILRLEEKGLYFNRNFSRTILSSVAPPGVSQHLSLLALDVKEHEDPTVRSILARHGWFQTIPFDLPHFVYLGSSEQQLASLGLRRVSAGRRQLWVPAVNCSDLKPQGKE